MNLRWVHAVLILLSAALAVLFGVWCLGQYGRETASRACSRPSRLSPCRSAWSSTTRGSCARRGRCDDPPSQLRCYGVGRPALRVVATAAAVVIGGGSSVLACPVCFGAEETSMIDGAKLGVLVLLAITLAVQGGFVGFFLYLRKRAKRIADIELDTEWSELQRVVENIMTEWLGLPPLASAHGGQIDSLIGWMHVFMLILFVGWGAFFAYCLIRFRRSRHPVANYTGVKSHTSSYLEVGVAVVEAILLFAFSIPLWAARVDHIPSESEALLVQVTGEQFAWNVHYAGPDGVFGRTDIKLIDLQSNPLGLDRSDPAAKDDVTTLNQLYLPVNKPIIVRLRSKDVIHSFGVPEFRVKQDAMPGLTIPIWFVPNVTTAEMRTRTGNPEFQYEIACAQLCGLGHCRMRGFVTVQTAEEFQKWMDEKVKEQSGPADPFK